MATAGVDFSGSADLVDNSFTGSYMAICPAAVLVKDLQKAVQISFEWLAPVLLQNS